MTLERVWLVFVDYGTSTEADREVAGVYGDLSEAEIDAARSLAAGSYYSVEVEEWPVRHRRLASVVDG